MPTPEHHVANGWVLLAAVLAFLSDAPWAVIFAGVAGSVIGVVVAGSISYKRGLAYVLCGSVMGYFGALGLVNLRIHTAFFTYEGISEPAAKSVVFFVMVLLIANEAAIREVIKSRILSWRAKS